MDTLTSARLPRTVPVRPVLVAAGLGARKSLHEVDRGEIP
jgi:hypothetical protein